MQGHASDSGEVTGQTTSTSNCIPRETAYYTIAAGDHIFVLRPEFNGKQIRLNAVTLGYANFFRKNSVLYHQLPGTSIWVRTEGNAMFVKVGKRESRYEVVEAR